MIRFRRYTRRLAEACVVVLVVAVWTTAVLVIQ